EPESARRRGPRTQIPSGCLRGYHSLIVTSSASRLFHPLRSLPRALCGTIRARFPNAKIVIGIWGANGEAPNMLERFARAGADSVATTIEQALDQLLGREQPLEKAK